MRIKDLIKAFDKGLQANNFDDFFSLLDKDKKLIRHAYGANHGTLLHHFCLVDVNRLNFLSSFSEEESEEAIAYKIEAETYREALERCIDEYGPNLNAVDKDGDTALHYAVMKNNIAAVQVLLESEGIDWDIANAKGQTPLKLASQLKYNEIEQALLKKSDHKVGKIDIPEGLSIKESQKQRKKAIVNMGPLTPMDKSSKPTAALAVESVLYFEDSLLAQGFRGYLETLSLDPILGPMVNMMGLCARRGAMPERARQSFLEQRYSMVSSVPEVSSSGEVDELYAFAIARIERELRKHFKIICIDQEDVTPLHVFVAEPRGLYTHKNSVFIATKNLDFNDIVAVIMHESMHFIVHKLFDNHAYPYPNDSVYNPLRDQMQEIVKSLRETLDSLQEGPAYDVIARVFYNYEEEKWPIEIIVRVPQIIALVGAEKGREWLTKNTPDLLSFYEQEVTPRIEKFLIDQRVSEHLSGFDHLEKEAKNRWDI